MEVQLTEANVLLLGARSVGKSALTVRFLTRRFIGEYGHIESVYSRVDRAGGQEIRLHVWDPLPPQDADGPSPSTGQLRWADGMILVYSICDRRSFDLIGQQLQRLRRRGKPPSVPVVVVGNKRDLHRHRSVSREEGRRLAAAHHCSFFEVSAAETYHDVLPVFHRLVELVRENRAPRTSSAGVRRLVRSVTAALGRKRPEWTRRKRLTGDIVTRHSGLRSQ